MECASEPDGITAGTEPRSRRAAVYQDRPAPPPPDGRAFLCPDPAFPAARAPRGPFHHQQVRSLRRHARAAALAVFAVLALALPAAAQSVTTLVSNAGQSTTSAPTGGADRAQAFTTGAAGATLSSVEIISEDNEGDDMAVSLCTVDSSGYPTSSCTALTAPSSFASGTLIFTDPASTTLAATTTYTLLITSPGGESLRLANTSSNAEETGAAAGWTIANTYHIKNSANVWVPGGFTTSFLITIKGTLSTTNTAATGAPTITGTAQVGQTLTAVTTGIMDADGLTSPTYTYQWIRVNGTEADIAAANSSTYTLVAADLGKTLKVRVTFDDAGGNTETLTSDATATVTGVVTNNAPVFSPATVTLEVDENTLAGQNVGSPVAATDADTGDSLFYTLEGVDADAFDIVSTSGQIRTKTGVTYDYEAQASYSVSVKADDGSGTSNATATAAVTIDLTDESEPPLAPDGPELAGVPGTFDSLSVHWDPPGNAGRPPITSYDIRYAIPPGAFADPDWMDGPRGVSGTTATLSALDSGRFYFVAVRAINAEGEGEWSDNSAEYVFRPPVSVDANSAYVPSDLGFGDTYRILFVTSSSYPVSTLRSFNDLVRSAAVAPLNDVVNRIFSTFRAVVSTRHVDARVNTGTTYTAAEKGVPIYWANGGRVADDYEDFYDGDWDDEANARNQNGDLQALPDGVWTGSGHDGTELIEGAVSRAFGQAETGYGTPGSSRSGAGPLYSGFSADSAEERPLYGLSLELRVAFPLLAGNLDVGVEHSDSAAARSQRFATGGNLYGYELESIGVGYRDRQGDRLSAALYTVDAQGRPDTLVASLSVTNRLRADLAAVDNRFAAPPGTVLDPGTNYAVVFRPVTAGTDVYLQATAVDSEDPDGQADWSIADTFEVESGGSWQADADGRSLQIEVRGTVRTGLPGAPTGLGATKMGRYRIDLAWTAPAFDGNLPITGYRIEVSPDGVTDWTDLVLDTGSTDTADTHTPLAPSTTRHYRVSAINSAGTGDPSGSADATTDPNTPPAFTVDAANVSVPENTPANTNISGANRTATDPDGDRRLQHQPHRELDRASQRRQAPHHGLRSAVPPGHVRELDQRPPERRRHQRSYPQPELEHFLPGGGARNQRRWRQRLVGPRHRQHRQQPVRHHPSDGGEDRRGQRASGGEMDGGGQRHGLQGAVEVRC